MAWWYARFLFHEDRLIDVGLHDVIPPAVRVGDASAPISQADTVTSVLVSGYSLYGTLRGYYAAGVARMRLDEAGAVHATEAAVHHQESLATLNTAQKAALRSWLATHSPDAWSTSLARFRRALGDEPSAAPHAGPGLPSAITSRSVP